MATTKKAVRKKAPAKRKKAAGERTYDTFRPPLGNQFWKMRSSHGRKPLFETGEKLWDACEEYFEWVVANPLKEEKVFCHQGQVTHAEISKMRAMTLDGMFTFLDICAQTWANYRTREEIAPTVARVERVIRDYKFAGAAADLLNPIIIASDLGLRNKIDHSSSDGTMTPTVIRLVGPEG